MPDRDLPPLPDNFGLPDHEPPGMVMRTNSTAVTPSGTMYQTYSERDWRIYRWIYARLTERVDRQIGGILDAVKENGREETTKPNGRMLRTVRWKYTIYEGEDPREILTDLENDPGEMTNLAVHPSSASILADCRRLILDWYMQTADEEGIDTFTMPGQEVPPLASRAGRNGS